MHDQHSLVIVNTDKQFSELEMTGFYEKFRGPPKLRSSEIFLQVAITNAPVERKFSRELQANCQISDIGQRRTAHLQQTKKKHDGSWRQGLWLVYQQLAGEYHSISRILRHYLNVPKKGMVLYIQFKSKSRIRLRSQMLLGQNCRYR